jgi:SAM-dependent methyltransferase
MKLNIGGGKNFNHSGWINLDAVTGFNFTPSCRFDLPDASVDLVYSSHCLEHLDDETVAQVLAESRRVIARHGRLVIVLPNFDDALHQYRSGNQAYFDQPLWGFDSVAWTWPRKNVPDSIATRCSMIFCGFWNKAWGDHFGGSARGGGNAYHGPAPVVGNALESLLDLHSPHDIADTLSSIVRFKETDYTFNHQNAWSDFEFMALVEGMGFKMSGSTDASIPGMFDMMPISSYYEAVPI